jgi:hypothetical protein
MASVVATRHFDKLNVAQRKDQNHPITFNLPKHQLKNIAQKKDHSFEWSFS